MKKRILLVVFLISSFCVVTVFSQDKKEKPNLSGTWEFEKSESLNSPFVTTDKSTENVKIFHQVVIEQKELEIKITEKIRYEFINPKTKKSVVAEGESSSTHFTDGRGESNTVNQKNSNSITKWKGNSLNVNFYDAKKNIIGTVEWKLSKDSKSLISIKKEKNPQSVFPLVLMVNPLLNNKTTFVRKL